MSNPLSEKQMKSIGVKKPFSETDVKIINSSASEFHSKVYELYALDIHAKSVLSPLLKTKDTFSKSVGDIYEYLMDSKVCLHCKGKISSCPKKEKGICKKPIYDKYNDVIRIALLPCELKKKEEEILARIQPSYIDPRIIKQEALLLLDWLENPQNGKQLKDSTLISKQIAIGLRNFRKEEQNKGMLFYGINSYALSRKLLFFAGYYYASKGYSVSHIDAAELFDSLKYVGSDLKNDDLMDFRRACSCSCLLVENLDKLGYLTEDIKSKYLKEFLYSRAEKGKITFFCFEKDITLSSALKPILYHQDDYGELIAIAESLAEKAIIKDLPL